MARGAEEGEADGNDAAAVCGGVEDEDDGGGRIRTRTGERLVGSMSDWRVEVSSSSGGRRLLA